MKKFLTVKNNIPLTIGIDELLKDSIYIVYGKSIGKEWSEIPRESIPDLIFCDSRKTLIKGNKINLEAENTDDSDLIPFIYLSTKIKINNLTVGIIISADDYIIKPISCTEMFKTIRR